MFIDKTKIFIKAGNGGDGAISFLRDAFTMHGGPDGGSGGKGGDIVFVADKDSNNLVDFYYTKHFRAEDGENGGHKNCNGKYGEDVIIKVPMGTVVRDSNTNNIIADIFYPDDRKIVLKGGNGGRGNAKFANSRRQSPDFAETGEKVQEYEVVLELKTIADVGLIGYPSVGKSKILSVLTSARPKVAEYHFTTLNPNLGVASYGDVNFLIADIPGLIEGASEGKGLGFEFLRHIERTRLLVHVVDIASVDGRDPIKDFEIINAELNNYSKVLAKLPQIVLLNKIDLLNDDFSAVERFKQHYEKDYLILTFSAATRDGKTKLLQTLVEKLSKLPKQEPLKVETYNLEIKDPTKFEIVKNNGVYELKGDMIDGIIRGINLSSPESLAYFQKRLKNGGVFDKMKEIGIKEGDTIRVSGFEFEFID